ncbi:MAG TPA: hypothetical protein VFF18_07180 [Woeseiaceae bacterium]|nr:hypothetical protein [Woeseiaceae bacterium]
MTESKLPEALQAIKDRGYVVWKTDPPAALAAKFTNGPIEVAEIRHVRVWGLQVDDERELPGHERTSIPDEELWQVELIADDGSKYEVSATTVEPAP